MTEYCVLYRDRLYRKRNYADPTPHVQCKRTDWWPFADYAEIDDVWFGPLEAARKRLWAAKGYARYISVRPRLWLMSKDAYLSRRIAHAMLPGCRH